jgi:hypothetical protein
VSRFGWNRASGGDRPEQGRGLGKATPTGGPRVAVTEAPCGNGPASRAGFGLGHCNARPARRKQPGKIFQF